jgi:hypothetical protein
VLPALVFNLDWTHGLLTPHNIGGIGMVLGTAVAIDVAVRRPHLFVTPVLFAVAMFFVYTNTKAAMGNLSLASEAASEAKQTKIDRGSQVASQESQLQKRRTAQVQLAGEQAVGVLEAAMRSIEVSDPQRWASTSQCEDVTAKASGAFCARWAEAKAKIEAARKRDEIDQELAKLRNENPGAAGATAQSQVADPYAANMKSLLEEAGYKPTERLIKAENALTRALSYELLAAFIPTCWLILIDMLQHGAAAVAAGVARARSMVRRKPRSEPVQEVKAAARVEAAEAADALDRCLADEFEEAPTGSMRAAEIRPIVHAWFDKKGLPRPKEPDLWSKVGARFKRDANNNRPRYLGLRIKVRQPAASPQLRIVGGSDS